MAIVGSAYVEIRALDTKLQRDIDKAVSKIKDVNITLQADVNLKPVREKISLLRAELRKNPLKFNAEVDLKHVSEKMETAYALYHETPLELKAEVDSDHVEKTLTDIKDRYADLHSNVVADAHTAGADAQIARAARDRRANIRVGVKMDPEIQKALRGLTYTLLGAVPGDKIKSALTGAAANFETLTISAAKMATVMGSVGAEGLTLGANIFALAGDLTNAVGIFATLPAGISTMAIGIGAMTVAWKGFGAAFSSNAKTAAKALATLPPEAQKAVSSLKGVWKEITTPAKNAFWKEMGTSLQDTVHNLVPNLKKGLEGTEVAMAKITKGVLSSLDELNKSGGLDKIFANTNKAFTNLSKGVKPFFDALGTLSVVGSKHIAVFGDWIGKLGIRFDNFIKKAAKAGDIDVWINDAVTVFKELGSVLGSSSSIFKGLTAISRMSGGKGLKEFAGGMKDIAKTVNSEPFKSNLTTILVGARRGAEALGTGFGKIAKVVGDSSTAIGGFLTLAGQIGGSLLGNISKVFNGTGFGTGMVTALSGAKKAMDSMSPAFHDFGVIMGNLGQIAGTLFVNMAPGINNLMRTVSDVIAALKDGLIKVIPIFNDFVQNIMAVAAPIAVALASALGSIFGWFAGLPKQIQTAIMAFGLFLLLKKKLADFFAPSEKGASRFRDSFKNAAISAKESIASIGSPIRSAFSAMGTSAANVASGIGKSLSLIGWDAKFSGLLVSDGFKKSFSQMGEYYRNNVAEPMSRFKAGFKSAFEVPHEVHDGFKRIGANIENTFRDAKNKVRNTFADMGKAVKGEVPHMVGALKEFPKEVAGIFSDAKIAAANALDDMGNKVADRSIYASKHLEDAGKGIQTAVKDVKAGATEIGRDLRAMGAPAELAVRKSVASMAVAGSMAANMVKSSVMATTAPVRSAIGSMVSSIKSSYGNISASARKSFAEVGVAATLSAAVAKDKFSNAFSSVKTTLGGVGDSVKSMASFVSSGVANATRPIRTGFSDAVSDVRKSFSGVGTAFTNLGGMASRAATTVRSSFATAAAGLKANFAPAAQAIGSAFSNISSNLEPARRSIRDLGTSAATTMGQLGSKAGGGLVKAAGGLLEALGGGWGIAIAGATIAITAFAQAQADSKKRVEDLASALDQQTGAFTGAAKNLATKSLFDGVTTGFDDFVRGVFQNSKTVNETLDTLGINTKKYTDTMMDPKGRDALIDGMGKVSFALKHGQEVTDDMANSIGMSKKSLDGLSFDDKKALGDSLDHAANKASDMRSELQRAEQDVKNLATATGISTVKAAIFAQNLETLKSTTSSASDKFAALKSNLDLINKSPLKADEGQKGYQQMLRDTTTAIDGIKSANEKAFPTFFDVKKGFDWSKQGAADLHSALSTQADGILKLGTDALDAALKNGKSFPQAQKAALEAAAPAIDAFKERLKGMGFAPGQIDGIVKSFGLIPKDIKTALKVEGTDAAVQEIFRASVAADAFKNGNYAAVLSALPKAAQSEIEKVTGLAGAFKNGDYEAILAALDKTEGGRQSALFKLLSVKNGKYEGTITAKDGTVLGTDAAKKTIKSVDGKVVPITVADKATAPAGIIKGVVQGLQGKTVPVAIADKASPSVKAAQVVVDAFHGKGASVTIFDKATKPTQGAQGVVDAFHGSAKVITIWDKASVPTQNAQKVVDSFSGKTVTIAVKDNVSGPLTFMQDAINRLSGKSININTNYTSSGTPVGTGTVLAPKKENGGIVNGRNVDVFANGGFSLVKAFAKGGYENHVAQIARGQKPYRVWAEPETGGEAYIPLSKGKRPRSLKILEQVAKMFGMGLIQTKAYANGGVEGGSRSSTSSSSLSPSNISPALLNSIAKGMMKDNTNLNKIGEYVVDGIIGGVNNKQGAAVESMTNMAGSLEDAVRQRLEIHSPSKTFLGLGKHIVDGLTLGLKANAGQVHKQISTLANQIYVAASDINKATGKTIGSSMKLIEHQRTLNGAWKKMSAWKYTDQIVDYYQKTGKTGNRTLADIARAREDVNVRLSAAQNKLKDLQNSRSSVISEISGRMKGEFKLGTNIIGETDPYIPQMRFSDVKNYASGLASRLKTFNSKIQALKKKGVSAGLIQEVASLGSVEGISVADAILQGSSTDIKGLNSTYASIGAIATQVGTTAADGMYKVGIDAQMGLVKGLQKDSASLTAAANQLTGQLIRQVKKNLGIKSPSRVFAQLGVFTSQGFIKGIDSMQSEVDKRVNNMINLDPRRVDVTGSVISSTSTTSSPQQVVNMTINPSTGMDEQAVGRAAVKELNWQLLSR